MTPATVERLFGWRHAYDHSVTVVIVAGLLALLAVTPLLITGLTRAGVVGADQRRELWRRYLSYDPGYRPVVLLILVAVELNDVVAYVCGKSFGRRKLAPNTSPNTTVGGALGAVLLTTPLVAVGMHFVFPGTPLDTPVRLAVLGLLVSVLGQFGDLILSSIKRDLGLKDLGVVIPSHGGLLDRFDSLILVAPAVFHYLNYFVGIGVGQPVCIFSGARVGP